MKLSKLTNILLFAFIYICPSYSCNLNDNCTKCATSDCESQCTNAQSLCKPPIDPANEDFCNQMRNITNCEK